MRAAAVAFLFVAGCTGSGSPPSGNTGGPVTRAITLNATGPGAVSGAGITGCRSQCVAQVADGAAITLTAVPDSGAVFSGWSQGCSGTGACTFTASADAQVTATFATPPPPPPGQHTLVVTKNGAGRVQSSPAGIDCGATCAASFASGTSISLSASPDAGSQFAGWGGACSGSGGCTVSLTADATVFVSFTAAPPPPPPDECAGLAPAAPAAPVRVQLPGGPGESCNAGHADGQGNLALGIDGAGATAMHFFDAAAKPLGTYLGHGQQLDEQAEGFLSFNAASRYASYLDWVKASGQVAGESQLGGSGYGESIDDPTGGVVIAAFVYPAAYPSSLAAYDAHAALRWKVSRSDGEIYIAHAVDRVGNTLLLTRLNNADTVHGTWFDHDGKQQAGSVAVGNFGQDVQLVPRIGSGFFLQTLTAQRHAVGSYPAAFVAQVDALRAAFVDPPAWLSAYDHRKLHPARGGTAYAFIDQSGHSADCSQRIEVVATTGKSCGSAAFNAGTTGACQTASIDVAWDGTVIQQLAPELEGHDPAGSQTSCTWQWWPGLLR